MDFYFGRLSSIFLNLDWRFEKLCATPAEEGAKKTLGGWFTLALWLKMASKELAFCCYSFELSFVVRTAGRALKNTMEWEFST